MAAVKYWSVIISVFSAAGIAGILIGIAWDRFVIRHGWRGWSFENMPLEEDEDV